MSDSGISTFRPACLSAALCLSLLAGACGSERLSAPKAMPIPGCEELDIAACDTLNTDCQKSRLELAACLREAPVGKLPFVKVVTEQEYVDYINAFYESRQLMGTNHFEVAMTWLGLAQPGSFWFDPISPSDIADWFGTYRWREKDLFLIDHGKPADDDASNVALVAALIRALRDRDIDIGVWTTQVAVFDVDSNWGADAMYFGEARFFSNRYKAALEGRSSFDGLSQINDLIRQDIDWIRTQPSPYIATNERFAHNFGARAAYLAWQKGGVTAVNALFEDKLITQQLMATETEQGPVPALRYHAIPPVSDEWDRQPIVTAVGAWGLFLALSKNLDPEAAWALALNWSGEQLYVYKGAEPNLDETALVWQLEMADETSASALEEQLKAVDEAAQVGRTGTFVTLAVASNGSTLDWAFVDE